jgi:hypothetical protein
MALEDAEVGPVSARSKRRSRVTSSATHRPHIHEDPAEDVTVYHYPRKDTLHSLPVTATATTPGRTRRRGKTSGGRLQQTSKTTDNATHLNPTIDSTRVCSSRRPYTADAALRRTISFASPLATLGPHDGALLHDHAPLITEERRPGEIYLILCSCSFLSRILSVQNLKDQSIVNSNHPVHPPRPHQTGSWSTRSMLPNPTTLDMVAVA